MFSILAHEDLANYIHKGQKQYMYVIMQYMYNYAIHTYTYAIFRELSSSFSILCHMHMLVMLSAQHTRTHAHTTGKSRAHTPLYLGPSASGKASFWFLVHESTGQTALQER